MPASVLVSVAVSSWSDSVVVSGGSGAGTLRLAYALNGTITGLGGATLILAGPFGSPAPLFDSGTVSLDIPFAFGVPFNIGASLSVSARASDLFVSGATLHSIADYAHTATQLPFLVLDQNLAPVPGSSVSSSDGSFSYVADPGGMAAVPEPAAALLLATALSALVIARRLTL